MTRRRSTAWSLPLVLTMYAAALAWIAWQSLRLNDGVFTYAQDDPYIHLAIARTLAAHGVWGISPDEFAGASSSPLWTVTLAALMLLTGPAAWWPLVLNVVAGAALLVVVHRQFARFGREDQAAPLGGAQGPATTGGARGAAPAWDEPQGATALLVFMFVLPLPTLVFIGMEHVAHVLAVVALAAGAARRLADEQAKDGVWIGGLVLAAVAAGLRYEGLFVVAAITGLALLRRRPVLALSLAAAGWVPVVLYAVYSVANGGWLLPNSIMIKSGAERFAAGGGIPSILTSWIGLFTLYQRPVQIALLLAAAALAALTAGRGRRPWNVTHLLLGVYAGTQVLHVCLVRVEWFYRYESYVVALGVLAITRALAEIRASGKAPWRPSEPFVRRLAIGIAAAALCLPLLGRAMPSFARTPVASGEIYRQQYQMARFLGDAYGGEAVAINDIGAVSWFAPVRVLDLIGLASTEITHARRSGVVDAVFMERTARQHRVSAAVIYESHFRTVRELPASWVKVADWTIPSAVGVYAETVAFFAPDQTSAARLRARLDEYAGRLPVDVQYAPLDPDGCSPTLEQGQRTLKDGCPQNQDLTASTTARTTFRIAWSIPYRVRGRSMPAKIAMIPTATMTGMKTSPSSDALPEVRMASSYQYTAGQ